MDADEHPNEHDEPDETHRFWEEFYGERDHVWSGRPNDVLVEEVDGLTPGTALDVGCGEGADAIWLASRGWRVTGADISQVALDRAARHADDAGVADRVTWERHDFSRSLPAGRYDLVSAQFLHSPVDDLGQSVLPRLAALVTPGGALLVVSHETMPWRPEVEFPTPAEVLAALAVDAPEWSVERLDSRPRVARRADVGEVEVRDSVVRVRRA